VSEWAHGTNVRKEEGGGQRAKREREPGAKATAVVIVLRLGAGLGRGLNPTWFNPTLPGHSSWFMTLPPALAPSRPAPTLFFRLSDNEMSESITRRTSWPVDASGTDDSRSKVVGAPLKVCGADVDPWRV